VRETKPISLHESLTTKERELQRARCKAEEAEAAEAAVTANRQYQLTPNGK